MAIALCGVMAGISATEQVNTPRDAQRDTSAAAAKVGAEPSDSGFTLLLGQLLGALILTVQQAALPDATDGAPLQEQQSAHGDKTPALPDTSPAPHGFSGSEKTLNDTPKIRLDSEVLIAEPAKKDVPARTGAQVAANDKADTAQKDHAQRLFLSPLRTTAADEQALQDVVKTGKEDEGGTGRAFADRTCPAPTDNIRHALQQDSPVFQQGQPRTGEATTAIREHHGTVARVADPADLFDNALAIEKDGSRLVVKLEPNGLGKLDINLTLERGMINARIQAADDTTKNLLEQNMQGIVDSLLREGLSVGGFSVSLKGGSGGDEGQKDRGDYEKRTADGVSDKVPATVNTEARGLINIFI